MKRIRTGSVPMDLILSGGFPARAIHMIVGPPGTGKTIFAERMAFATAARPEDDDRSILYLTTLSEPMAKFITFLQAYAFADIALLGTKVIYESIAEDVTRSPSAVAPRVVDLLRQHRPRLVIIDSIKAIGDLMPDLPTWRKVLYELAGVLTAYDTTTFWVGEYTSEMIPTRPEFAVADGIIELDRQRVGSSDSRTVRVIKLRGSSFFPGNHPFRITPSGIDVFPRMVTPDVAPSYTPTPERVRSGIIGLDDMIRTGWLRGTSTIVAGPSGAGKTVLGLHFLRAGVQDGEPCLYIGLEESPTQLQRIIHNFGWRYDELVGPDKLDILYASPVELLIDEVAGEIFQRIDAHGVRRIVVDALSDIERNARDPGRFTDYLYAFMQQLAHRNVTGLFTLQAAGEPAEVLSGEPVLKLGDNTLLIGFQFATELKRTIRILKSRGSAHDGRARELVIGKDGIVVGE